MEQLSLPQLERHPRMLQLIPNAAKKEKVTHFSGNSGGSSHN